MKKPWIFGVIGLGSLLIVSGGISPAVGESNKLGEGKRPVMVASETPSFGAEDCIVESCITPSFGTEDWVLASETASFGSEDWVEGMESSDVVATGTLPAPAR
jgi:hypothetical protein